MTVEHGKLHKRHLKNPGSSPKAARAPLTRDVAMMVRSPDVDDAFETPLVFVQVIGNVGSEVRVESVVALHDAILLVAKGR